MSFHCSQCGECCRHINLVPQLAEFDQGNGVCINLRGNKCAIYENRPEICNVDLMYEKYFASTFSREEFYALNEVACRELSAKNAKKCNCPPLFPTKK